jgi:hypothetical protein
MKGLRPPSCGRTIIREGQKADDIHVLDYKGLQRVAKFDSTYLHLVRTERRDSEVSQRVGDLVAASPHGLLHDAAEKVKSVFGRLES